MINAGAIATTSLVAGRSPADKHERLLAVFGLYAGRPLTIDDEALDRYFRQCSILVDCRDLALIAATLANGGVTRNDSRPGRSGAADGSSRTSMRASSGARTSSSRAPAPGWSVRGDARGARPLPGTPAGGARRARGRAPRGTVCPGRDETQPAVRMTILENLLRNVYHTMNRLDQELVALGG